MKDVFLPVIIGVLGISGLLYGVIETAEVKGYSNIKSCNGECYEAHVAKYGTVVEIERAKAELQEAQQELASQKRESREALQTAQAKSQIELHAAEEKAQVAQTELQEAQTAQAKLQEAQANLNQFRQQAQALAQQGQEEDLAPLQAKAVEAVKTVAEDKGIDLVVPKNNLIYSSDALDISDAVIAVLNSGD